ncbi:DUF4173 domain-containing protein [Rhizobium sp. B230/85]|nr:DUF4173 domain-containing protein [Rhizobium sp. B209b/85]QXZ98524.1 DUF4173 domain-containing protein [Rhizobium sp. B230/85]
MSISQTSRADITAKADTRRIFALVLLIVLSDYLLFGQNAGFNLFLFSGAVTIAVLVLSRKHLTSTRKLSLLGVSVLCSLPLLESATPLGIGISVCAIMAVALICSGMLPRRWSRMHLVLLRFAIALPLPLFEACRRQFLSPRHGSSVLAVGRGIGLWLIPLALASVFLALFAMANPLIEQTIRNIRFTLLLQFLDIRRVGFWLLVATGVWAMLRPRLVRRGSGLALTGLGKIGIDHPLLGHALMVRSLIIFNALFAAQSILDVVYLWSGADLPDGLTHAEYAHRGAYPLIATALLAAAFVLMTMKRDGPGDRSPLIRGLVFVWIAQNILLCLSSLMRLDLYVEAYSLTEMRIAAGIWMGLVAVGLLLILLRIVLRHSNEWLVAVNIAALAIVLYVCAVLDLPSFIARFNVLHSREVSNEGVTLDLGYLASLGPSSIPAIDLYVTRLMSTGPGYATGLRLRALQIRQSLSDGFKARPDDWRGWTFRASRLKSYLQSEAAIATWHENGDNENRQF